MRSPWTLADRTLEDLRREVLAPAAGAAGVFSGAADAGDRVVSAAAGDA
ncbi:MAG: hypothetical protein WCA35_06305 [Kovacikia sp.]